jgi:hypothetical protein
MRGFSKLANSFFILFLFSAQVYGAACGEPCTGDPDCTEYSCGWCNLSNICEDNNGHAVCFEPDGDFCPGREPEICIFLGCTTCNTAYSAQPACAGNVVCCWNASTGACHFSGSCTGTGIPEIPEKGIAYLVPGIFLALFAVRTLLRRRKQNSL